MNKITTIFSLSALVLGTALLAPKAIDAYRGDPTVTGPNYTVERHEAMQKAFSANDYTAWKNLMQNRGRVTQVVNQDNFAQFAKAHQLALEGKMDEAAKIRQELGLGQGKGNCNR